MFVCSLLDVFLVWSPVVSLSMSPTGDFLSSCHIDDLGVYLWANKSLYTHVDLKPLPADFTPRTIEAPSTSHRSQGMSTRTRLLETPRKSGNILDITLPVL